jgi:hypothetical protein
MPVPSQLFVRRPLYGILLLFILPKYTPGGSDLPRATQPALQLFSHQAQLQSLHESITL